MDALCVCGWVMYNARISAAERHEVGGVEGIV